MRILTLGGTVFLGRHVASEALRRGHEVALFHRGRHGNELFPEAEHLHGDRGGDLSALEGRRFDAAVDTSGYQPADVAASSALLAAAGVEHLSFVSTCNVYPGWPDEPVSEDSPVWTEGDDYGPNKAACEREAEAALPGRVAALRAGLLCGPHDNVFGCRGGCSGSPAAARSSRPAIPGAPSSSSTCATSPPGSSTSPSTARPASSTPPRRSARPRCARSSTLPSPPPGRTRG